MKKKINLSINCDEVTQMQASIFSQIGKDGLRFLRQDIHVGPEGMTTIGGNPIASVLKINKESLSLANRQLGKGASCHVQEGVYLPENINVAIKTINIYDKDKRRQIMNDIRILLKNLIRDQNSGYVCKFIVNLYGAYFDQGSVKVILQLMDVGSLETIISLYRQARVAPQISEAILAKICLQILCGLSFLHSHNMVHRDIKPGNILLNSKGQVKVTDFGISKQFVDKEEFSKTFVGTRAYMSPQRILGHQYTYSSDIWGFGLVLLELSTGKHPYTGKDYIYIQQSFANEGPPALPQSYSQDMRDFLQNCLQIDPQCRASSLQLLGHPWILKNISKKASINQWLETISNEVIPLISSTKK